MGPLYEPPIRCYNVDNVTISMFSCATCTLLSLAFNFFFGVVGLFNAVAVPPTHVSTSAVLTLFLTSPTFSCGLICYNQSNIGGYNNLHKSLRKPK